MVKIKGSRKLRRCGKKQGYYTNQFLKTSANKLRRAIKRKEKKALWQMKKAESAVEEKISVNPER